MTKQPHPANARILYVEDDEALAFLTVDQLQNHGFHVEHYSDGKSALQAFSNSNFDLCILDVMLPNLDGFALTEKIRSIDPQIPILLKTGADDYILKPYSMEELVLRIQVFLKRKSIVDTVEPQNAVIGAYRFEPSNLKLIFGAEEIYLTQRESELLGFLNDRRSKVVKRADILKHIWGHDDYFLGRSLDVFISRLRKHLSKDEKIKIENIHGVGFCFKVES